MGQQEIINILKKNKNKWLSSKEIRKLTNLRSSGVNYSLNSMLKFNEVEMKVEKINHHLIPYYRLK
jgi:hypothetical protein